jgi:hypothetical protein
VGKVSSLEPIRCPTAVVRYQPEEEGTLGWDPRFPRCPTAVGKVLLEVPTKLIELEVYCTDILLYGFFFHEPFLVL